MGILFFIVSGVIAILVFGLVSSRRARQLFRQRLANEFGKAPTSFNPDIWGSVSDYWDRKRKYEQIDVAIDELTWSDLDMDDVFKRLDTCLTSVGDEYLYAILHQPQWTEKPLKDREQYITYFATHPRERLEMQMILSRLGKTSYNDVTALIFESQLKALKNPRVYTILAMLPLFGLGLCLFNLSVGLAALVLSLLVNGVVYYYFREKTGYVYSLSSLLCGLQIRRSGSAR